MKLFHCVDLDLWECPEGYLLFQEKCYKLIREKKSHVQAQRNCSEQGGQIAFPHTHIQVGHELELEMLFC